jgi:hypothetical protein
VSDSLKIPAGVVVSAAGRVKYPRDLAEYGVVYGRKEVAVRSWVRLGKGNGELPPLDSPAEMTRWWKRWMKHQLPDALERAAIEEKREDLVLESSPLPVDPVADVPPESITLTTSMAGSASDSLERLRSASALYYSKLQEALDAGDRAEADSWRKDWLAAEEKQRHWEKDINKILLERGEMVRKADLLGPLSALAGTLRRNFLVAFREFARDVAPNLTDAEIDVYARPHVEECFRRLRENEFSAALRA